jgi:hypothetical protein
MDLRCFCCTTLRDVILVRQCFIGVMSTTCILHMQWYAGSPQCPGGTPSSSAKIRSPFKTLHFYCFMHYAFFLECIYFCFPFSFGLFAIINGWITSCLFWRETRSVFHCQEHSSFHSYRSMSVLFFCYCI